MTEKTEAEVVAYLAQNGTEARPLVPGTIYTLPNGDEGISVTDTDKYAPAPRRINSNRIVSNAESFVHYLEKHGLPQTEVYADTPNSSVIAVVDSHVGANMDAGWQGHTAKLVLEHTKSWKAWTERDGQWFSQIEFAEFIEQRATDIVEPVAGDLMSLAQNFYMTKGVEYESSERLADGQTNLVYKEKVTSKGLGKLDVPKELKLIMQPYVGGPKQYAFANFRTRLDGAALRIGYVLVRPEEILDGVFADIVGEIRNGRTENKETGLTGFDGITHPIFFGKP